MSATNYSQRSYNSFAAGNASLQANSAKTKSTKSKEYESKSQPPLLTSKNAADESNEMSDAISKEDKVFSSYLFMLRMADNFAKQLNYYESIRSAEAALFLRIRKANIIEPRLKEVATQDTTSNKSQSTRKEIDERNQGKTKVKKSKQHHRHSTHTQEEETTPLEPTQKTRSHKTKKMNNKTNKNDDDITDVGKKPSFLYSALHHSVIEQVKELLLRCNTYAVEEFSHDKYESASFFLDKALFLTSERTYFDAAEESEITDESKKEHDDEGEEEKRNEKEEEELWNASNKTSSAINSRTTSIASANMEKDSDNTWKYKENDNKIKSDSKKGQLIVLFHHASDHNNNNSEEVERLRLHAATLNNFGCMERRRGRYIKSLEYFQQAIRVQIKLTNDVMYTYPHINNNNSNNNRKQDNTVQPEVEKGEKESVGGERSKDRNDEREAENNEEVCMDKLPSLLLSLASSYCNLNLLYNDMFMYGEAVAAAQRAIHVLEQAQETMTEMEQLLLMRSKSKNRKENNRTTKTNKTETKMLLRMLMMAYHNLGISLMRKSEANNNTTTNMANKLYQAGSMGSNRASLQSTMTAASAANDQEEVLLAQHAFEHAQAIHNRLALIEHKNTNKENNIHTYGITGNTISNEAKTTINAKEETHEEKKKEIGNEFWETLENLNVSEAGQKEVDNAVQTPLHVEEETQQTNAKNSDLQHFTSQNNFNHNMHSVINATTSPERLAQTCSPLTLNAALQQKTNKLIQTWNQQSDITKDIIEYKNYNNGSYSNQSDDARNVFMSTAPAKLYRECATESSVDKQVLDSQQANTSQSLEQCVENNKSPKEEEKNSQEEKQTVKHKEDEMEKGAGVALPQINKWSSTNTARDQMLSKEKEMINHDECVNNTSNKDINFTAPSTTGTTLSLPALEERNTKEEARTSDINLVNKDESHKENKMDRLSINNHENDKLPPVQNTHSNKRDDDNIDEKDYKNDLYKRISLTKEFDARNGSLSLVQNHKPSPGSSQSQRQRRSILDRINDRLKSTNSLNKNLNSNNPLANYNRLSTTSSAMPEGNLFANAARKKSSLVASVNSINNNNNNNVRNKRHSRKSLIASKNKLYRKEQAELANQMISALEHKVQLEEKQQRRRAAIAIQKIVKGVLVRTQLSLKLKAVLLLQRNVRIFLSKVRIIHAHEALIKQKEEQRQREKELKAAILIQRRLRSFLQRLHEKKEIEAQARRLHRAACVIQRYYRTYCTRKLIKQEEEQRAHELAKRQEQFIQRHAALRIAHAYKEYKQKCEQTAQKEQLELSERAALMIQSH